MNPQRASHPSGLQQHLVDQNAGEWAGRVGPGSVSSARGYVSASTQVPPPQNYGRTGFPSHYTMSPANHLPYTTNSSMQSFHQSPASQLSPQLQSQISTSQLSPQIPPSSKQPQFASVNSQARSPNPSPMRTLSATSTGMLASPPSTSYPMLAPFQAPQQRVQNPSSLHRSTTLPLPPPSASAPTTQQQDPFSRSPHLQQQLQPQQPRFMQSHAQAALHHQQLNHHLYGDMGGNGDVRGGTGAGVGMRQHQPQPQHLVPPGGRRDRNSNPLCKLTVGLLTTYKHINKIYYERNPNLKKPKNSKGSTSTIAQSSTHLQQLQPQPPPQQQFQLQPQPPQQIPHQTQPPPSQQTMASSSSSGHHASTDLTRKRTLEHQSVSGVNLIDTTYASTSGVVVATNASAIHQQHQPPPPPPQQVHVQQQQQQQQLALDNTANPQPTAATATIAPTNNPNVVMSDAASTSNIGGGLQDDKHGDLVIQKGDVLMERFTMGNLLGKGSFGQVIQAFDRTSGDWVALKIIKGKKAFFQQAQTEIDILTKLNQHDPTGQYGVVKMKEHFVYKNHQCIVFELLSHNLYDVIRHSKYKGIKLSQVRTIAWQVLQCLQFLAQDQVAVIHCDLKPENVLLVNNNSNKVKIIDFGSSCYKTKKMFSYIQSRFYRSPEVMLGLDYGPPIDCWSLGCILVELLTGDPLFGGVDTFDQMRRICLVMGAPPSALLARAPKTNSFFDVDVETGTYVLKRPVAPPPKEFRPRPLSEIVHSTLSTWLEDKACTSHELSMFQDLVQHLLEFDPLKRISPASALQHHFFASSSARRASMPATPAVSNTSINTLSASTSIPTEFNTTNTTTGNMINSNNVAVGAGGVVGSGVSHPTQVQKSPHSYYTSGGATGSGGSVGGASAAALATVATAASSSNVAAATAQMYGAAGTLAAMRQSSHHSSTLSALQSQYTTAAPILPSSSSVHNASSSSVSAQQQQSQSSQMLPLHQALDLSKHHSVVGVSHGSVLGLGMDSNSMFLEQQQQYYQRPRPQSPTLTISSKHGSMGDNKARHKQMMEVEALDNSLPPHNTNNRMVMMNTQQQQQQQQQQYSSHNNSITHQQHQQQHGFVNPSGGIGMGLADDDELYSGVGGEGLYEAPQHHLKRQKGYN